MASSIRRSPDAGSQNTASSRADARSAQRLSGLRQNEIFETFNAMDMARLVGAVEELEVPRHHIVFSPQAPAEFVFLIDHGRVRLTKVTSDGRALILALLGPGDLILEAIWDVAEQDTYCETLDEARLYQIPRETFDHLVRQNSDFAIRIMQLMGTRLSQAQLRIEDLVFRQVPGRIARLLVSLAEHHGKVTPNGIRIEFPLTHQEIADLVGSSRVTVTQVLNRFRTSEFISIESKRVAIHDLPALEALVKES